MDIVYFVGKGAIDGLEFQYSLRSLAQNLPHENVWLVGPDYPSNLKGVKYVPWRQRPDKATDVFAKWKALPSITPEMADEVYVTCDDEYMLRAMPEIPLFHWRTSKERGGIRAEMPWVKMVAKTDDWLRDEHGIKNPLHFDVHTPMPVNRRALGTIVHQLPDHTYLPRTVYGNMVNLEGTPLRSDVKVRTAQELFAILGEANGFLSSADDTFTTSGVEYLLRTLFPDPCRYEIGR